MRIRLLGEQALIADVPAGSASGYALGLRCDPFWLSVVPGAASILVRFPTGTVREARARFRRGLANGAETHEGRTISIPVVYGGDFGPDLAAVAGAWGMTVENAAIAHSRSIHEVLFLGFMPGFPYLQSGHPPVDRLATPRTKVPAGSIGVAGTRTGIYPRESPGGWRIIGRTPSRLFDTTVEPPAALSPGDRVMFFAILAGEWETHRRFPLPE